MAITGKIGIMVSMQYIFIEMCALKKLLVYLKNMN